MDFESVYKKYYSDIYRYSFSLAKNEKEAEELTQDTFVKALKSIDRYDGSKDLRAWLFTIAKNSFISKYRKSKHESEFELISDEIRDTRKGVAAYYLSYPICVRFIQEEDYVKPEAREAFENITKSVMLMRILISVSSFR
ncbi:RNA polymerase sigma factor [Butyrivibrio sp. AE3004]|uniref:RNA polymerase sigma factor n=1 Tax=Butyrivibrio sp. AE3004 TaxID=1506994 RepID=UPI000692498F|nr:RNA polymerase sigma factor [Butyrivibrio sp. AE3004]